MSIKLLLETKANMEAVDRDGGGPSSEGERISIHSAEDRSNRNEMDWVAEWIGRLRQFSVVRCAFVSAGQPTLP